MRSFKYKNSRTIRLDATGKVIRSFFNASSKQSVYTNQNPRFTITNTCTKGGMRGGRGCTNVGCGKQCCHLSFLIKGVSRNEYISSNYKSLLVPGQIIKNSTSGVIGTINVVILPYACCQDPSGVIDCSGTTWPLTIRIIANAESGSCANSNYSSGNIKIGTTTIGGTTATTIEENYEVIGTSRKGAPYRNPIFGYRKFLADPSCCYPALTKSSQPTNDIYKDMHAKYTNKTNLIKVNNDLQQQSVTSNNCVAYDFRIRSGMQPKTACCKIVNGKVCEQNNNYSYDYRQYLNNKSLKSFKRSQDKFFVSGNLGATGTSTTDQINVYTKGNCLKKCCDDTASKFRTSNPTIYKPNNKKFSQQGAVSSGSRLERLKLATLRAANGCNQSNKNKCNTLERTNGTITRKYTYGCGLYFAGKPRYICWRQNKNTEKKHCTGNCGR